MPGASYRFSNAIVRSPSASVTNGLRAVDVGPPDLEVMRAHHRDYINALKQAGAHVDVLDPLDDFPDGLFVEDTALCLPDCAILMRPGAASRRGEVAHIAHALTVHYGALEQITGPGFLEAGDILTTDHEVLVGRSARTDSAGIAELRSVIEPRGYHVREVDTPPEILHFKTDCGLLDGDTVLATRRLAATGCFANYKVVEVADGEEAAANVIRFNDVVIMPAGFAQTQARIERAGFRVVPIGNSECAKIDGGMSCLSLRFSAPR